MNEIIEILKTTLEFYSKTENYENGNILKDSGHQAKFTLDLVKKINEEHEKGVSVYEKHIKDMTSFFKDEKKQK